MSAENVTHVVNRSGWSAGPWDGEPDRVEWRAHGMPCLIARSPSTGALCGYVGVPPGHPLHGKSYGNNEVDELEVHGGITYGAACGKVAHICHVPLEGEPAEVWWLGFDCGHAFDTCPQMASLGLLAALPSMSDFGDMGGDSYKDVAYVTAETERLAAQLAAVSS